MRNRVKSKARANYDDKERKEPLVIDAYAEDEETQPGAPPSVKDTQAEKEAELRAVQEYTHWLARENPSRYFCDAKARHKMNPGQLNEAAEVVRKWICGTLDHGVYRNVYALAVSFLFG